MVTGLMENNDNDSIQINVDELEPMQRAMLEAIIEQGVLQERRRVISILEVLIVAAAAQNETEAEVALQEAIEVIKDDEAD